MGDSSLGHKTSAAPPGAALSVVAAWLAATAALWPLLTDHWINVALLALLAVTCAVVAYRSLAVPNWLLATMMMVTALVRAWFDDASTLDALGCAVLGDWLVLLTCRSRDRRWQNPIRLGALAVGMLASVAANPPVLLQGLLLLVLVTGLVDREPQDVSRASITQRSGPLLLSMFVVGAWVVSRVVLAEYRIGGTMEGSLASSGGTTLGDPRSSRGVGEGDDEADSAHNASAGFDESNNFMDSNLDTLYDLFAESFGRPVPPDANKVISLRQEEANVVRGRDEFDGRSGRRFELKRKPPERPPDRIPDTDALLVVSQRGPLRLRLQAFDRFDGDEWSAIRSAPIRASLYPDLALTSPSQSWWTMVDQAGSVAVGGSHRVKVRVVRYRSRALPLPPITRKFCLGRVDEISFFCEAPGGVLMLRERNTPPGSVIESIDERVNWARLDDSELMRCPVGSAGTSELAGLPESVRPIVRQWIEGKRRGWDEVKAVLDGLRSHATLDRYVEDVSAAGIVETLLVTRRRGNSQHFATAAAVILSELGYVTRFATGFYVDPTEYDPEKDQTPLHPRDLHCWPEIRLQSMLWIPLEATPGYMAESAAPGFLDHLLAYRVPASSVAAVAALLWLGRRRLLDAADHALTKWSSWQVGMVCLPRTVRFLDRRLSRVGLPRRTSQTVAEHLLSVGSQLGIPATQLKLMVTAIERWQFGPDHDRTGLSSASRDAIAKAPRWFAWHELSSLRRRSSSQRVQPGGVV